jgi:hypothetical protein
MNALAGGRFGDEFPRALWQAGCHGFVEYLHGFLRM